MKPNIKEIEDNLENFKAVQYRMNNEGIDYCFNGYSNWDEIEDEEFHKLRNEFLESMKKIRSYVENKIETLSEQIDTEWMTKVWIIVLNITVSSRR